MKSNIRTIKKAGGSMQVTIPARIVRELGIKEGAGLQFSQLDDNSFKVSKVCR